MIDSGPMVGMINQNGDRPVNLLKKHDAHQPVRPGHGAKRQELAGILAELGGVAVRTPDQKGQFPGAVVQVALQQPGEIPA